MQTEKVRAYFSFTKKERTGVLVLTGLILFIFILPYFFPSSPGTVKNRQAFEQYKNEIAQLKTQPQGVSPGHDHTAWNKQQEEDKRNEYEQSKRYTPAARPALFYFDPNTITPEQWKALGLREKTIHTIQHYIDKGGKFRSSSDLQKVYGLHPDEYLRLSAYVRIENTPVIVEEKKAATLFHANNSSRKPVNPAIIDINSADTAAFTGLPGIGSKLANRIINFREKLGGFFAVNQVAETYALPDSTFVKIKSFLKVTDETIKKIDVNKADANTLKQHPYIKWNIANAIVQYRKQHGDFKSLEELQQIALVTPEVYEKIGHYLRVGDY